MSRRHHGSRPHRPGFNARPVDLRRTNVEAPPSGSSIADEHVQVDASPVANDAAPTVSSAVAPTAPGEPAVAISEWSAGAEPLNGRAAAGPLNGMVAAGCTAPQLRRFIKSRPYVPMHELRRRFGINGSEDDVTPVELVGGRVFVGLPQREGALLGELLRGGEIGYELSLDPRSPVVVGLYPMRPVART
jgi:hypothetical protein